MADVPLPVVPRASDREAGDAAAPTVDPRRVERELSRLVEGEVRFTVHDRMLYATDASIYQVEPLGVVVPRSVTDIEKTVAYCAAHGLPVLPRGGGTSLAGQTVNAAIVIDDSAHCTRLVAVDVPGRSARVEPGIVLDDLNRALAAHGLMFGPDVATSTHATLGGMIGNNSAGARSVLYGRTVEHVAALDVVTADGARLRLDRGAAARDDRVAALTQCVADVVWPVADAIDARYPRTRRRVNGYNLDLVLDQLRRSTPGTFDAVNLAHLLCGSEGTLAVTVEATLGLVETPRRRGLAIVAFEGVDAALAAVEAILATGPAAVELVDDVIIGLALDNLEHRRNVELLPPHAGGVPGAVLYVEYFGDDEASLAERRGGLAARHGETAVRWYEDSASMARAWQLRKAGEPLLHGQPGRRKPVTFIEDTAVEPARLPEFVRRFRAIVDRHGTTASYYAHASVGCLHIRPMICLDDDEGLRSMEEIVAEATDLVVEFGGALSGEHGDGRLRSHLLERFYGPEIVAAFRAIKAIFDPEGRLNPGNIVAPGPMTEHLRVRPGPTRVRVPGVETFFRYEREHGLAGAVEMCNGAGVCRKTAGGTMCPSYRATRDERHATRGRGNALRLAITGQFAAGSADGSADGSAAGRSSANWADAETIDTLDLCLSCKACKSECPSNVDIAKLKAEYLAQGYARGSGPPLRARVFGAVRILNRLGAIAPGLANAANRFAPVRALVDRALGLDPRRSLPTFSTSLYRWAGGRHPRAEAGAPAVVLLPDCFTVYNEAPVGQAAVEVLEMLGYRVVLPRVGCCGRPLISGGLLRSAASVCAATAKALARACAEVEAVALLAVEPSCLSAVTDDWGDLEMDVDRGVIADLATRSMLVEDFIEARWDEHPRRVEAPSAVSGPVLVHGHCHQKTLWGAERTLGLLARAGCDRVELVDSTCCGMAGAFGYTRDHFDLSMSIAELELFPALRARPDAAIAAPGTSCRHQIRDGLGRVAEHPIELVARAWQPRSG